MNTIILCRLEPFPHLTRRQRQHPYNNALACCITTHDLKQQLRARPQNTATITIYNHNKMW